MKNKNALLCLPWLIIMSAVFVVCGCDSITGLFNQEDDDTEKAEDEVISASSPGLDCIGYGYDVFLYYPNPDAVKYEVLDVEKLLTDKKIYKRVLDNSTCSESFGSSFEEYSDSYATKGGISGSYSYYSASIKYNFSSSSLSSKYYSYGTISTDINKSKLYLTNGADYASLRDYITGDFDAYLNTADPNDDNADYIFTNYGTHVLTGIILGARMDWSMEAKKTSSYSTSSVGIDAYAKYEYKTLFSSASVSASLSESEQESAKKDYSDTATKTYVLGGASEYGTSNPKDNASYMAWIETVADNPVFCNVSTTGGVVPIYELAKDAARREFLKGKYEAYAKGKEIKIDADAAYTCIIDFYVSTLESGNDGAVKDYEGRKYFLIDQDLNEGAGGNDVYLYACYGKSDGSSGMVPISQIGIVLDDDADDAAGDLPDGWIRRYADLNSGASGDYINLIFYRSANELPITNVYVHDQTDGTRTYPGSHDSETYQNIGYEETKRYVDGGTHDHADLNKEAGGDYIFLYYSKGIVD